MIIKKSFAKIASFMLFVILLSGFGTPTSGAAPNASSNGFKSNEAYVDALAKTEKVYLGGIPFGVKFFTDGITVVGFSDVDTDSENKSPAYNAGIRENDVIISVNNAAVSSVDDFISAAEKSQGNSIEVGYKRLGKVYSASFSPVLSKSDNKYKTGMWIKDSTAGIGTITYVIPETRAFAGLGHSICDSSTGEILKLTKGVVMDVEVSGIEKSTPGTPGELKGSFSSDKIGTLSENTSEGIYGVFSEIPESLSEDDIIEVADRGDVKEGAALIRCTVEDGKTDEYEVNLSQINFDEDSNKNYVIEVTDQRLIEKTGGIVQGMSGSPIIQNGKLVGAVTHVFISDPKKGYGISIENMLESMPDILK